MFAHLTHRHLRKRGLNINSLALILKEHHNISRSRTYRMMKGEEEFTLDLVLWIACYFSFTQEEWKKVLSAYKKEQKVRQKTLKKPV